MACDIRRDLEKNGQTLLTQTVQTAVQAAAGLEPTRFAIIVPLASSAFVRRLVRMTWRLPTPPFLRWMKNTLGASEITSCWTRLPAAGWVRSIAPGR